MDLARRASIKLTFIPFNDELNSAINCSEVAAICSYKFTSLALTVGYRRFRSEIENKHLHRRLIIIFAPQLFSGKLIWLKIKFERFKMISSLNVSSSDAAENSQCKMAWQNLALL